jgi:hypothetical protein
MASNLVESQHVLLNNHLPAEIPNVVGCNDRSVFAIQSYLRYFGSTKAPSTSVGQARSCLGLQRSRQEDVGKWEFSGKVRAARNVAATSSAATRSTAVDFTTYNFTEITITTPLMTRIVNRLFGGGIILCGNVV